MSASMLLPEKRFAKLHAMLKWHVEKLRFPFGFLRLTKMGTQLCGFKYERSRRLVEIDLTYACNLLCHNCNRSCAQAREDMEITVQTVVEFVNESISNGFEWDRIRVLGGEPTLHSKFYPIIEELLRYKRHRPSCLIQVVSNGFGPKVNDVLRRLPDAVDVANGNKKGRQQLHFMPFNLAPIDNLRFRFLDFRNGCHVIESSGFGLTPVGYYPCAVAGGIARIEGVYLGRANIPKPNDDMRDLLGHYCRLCGFFRGNLHLEKLNSQSEDNSMSRTWKDLYFKWKTTTENAKFHSLK
jgi:hypothetical protein